MLERIMNESLPVRYEADVLVVGGGPAGTAAAFAAARKGADVMIVEQFNCLGGVSTAGGHGHMCLYSSWHSDERVVGGIPFEIVERVTKAGYGVHDNSYADFEVEGMKLVLDRMAAETGTRVIYHTFFSDVLMEDGVAAYGVIQNKDGRSLIKAKQVIDCTGDGDVAFKAGCGYEYGEPESGLCQPVTLMFTIGGVDYDKVRRFREEYPKLYDDPNWGMTKLWESAQAAGDMQPFQSVTMGWWWTPTRPDHVGVNFTHVTRVDSRSADELTRATIVAREQAFHTIEVYRKYVPGMEDCYMVSTPATIGIRESRRIHTDYTLTENDVLDQASFDDTIGYGSFYVDIHNLDGPGMDKQTVRPDPGFKYQIPWRICLASGVKNLQVAGRCAGADHVALGSLRVMPQCAVMGQATGTAAALAADGADLREIGIEEVQSDLRTQGCILDQQDIDALKS